MYMGKNKGSMKRTNGDISSKGTFINHVDSCGGGGLAK